MVQQQSVFNHLTSLHLPHKEVWWERPGSFDFEKLPAGHTTHACYPLGRAHIYLAVSCVRPLPSGECAYAQVSGALTKALRRLEDRHQRMLQQRRELGAHIRSGADNLPRMSCATNKEVIYDRVWDIGLSAQKRPHERLRSS